MQRRLLRSIWLSLLAGPVGHTGIVRRRLRHAMVPSCNSTWSDAQCIPWALFGPGEYVGPARPAHVETYYLRVNDNITLTFIASRKKSAEHYRIGVGDELQIEWLQGAGEHGNAAGSQASWSSPTAR